MSRSIRVRKDCILQVKMAMRRNYCRQKDLAAALNISQSTISNFLAGKPVYVDNFKEICQALKKEWQEIADLDIPEETILPIPQERAINLEQMGGRKSLLIIELSATIEEFDKPLIDAMVAVIKQRGEISYTYKRIEIGSVVLVLESTPEGCSRIETLFRTGQLTEILGIPILSVRVEPLPDLTPEDILQQLRQELEKLFNADWQPPERLLATSNARSRIDTSALENSIRRAKEINLGTGQAVVLVIQMTPEDEDEVGINIWVYPTRNAIHLPAGMQVMVLDEFGAIVPDLQAQAGNSQDSIQVPFSVEPGEPFGVRIVLGDFIVTEYF